MIDRSVASRRSAHAAHGACVVDTRTRPDDWGPAPAEGFQSVVADELAVGIVEFDVGV
jgi:hypothetical protein